MCGHVACMVERRGAYSVLVGKLHNEEVTDLYRSPNIIQVIKPRRMRWAGM